MKCSQCDSKAIPGFRFCCQHHRRLLVKEMMTAEYLQPHTVVGVLDYDRRCPTEHEYDADSDGVWGNVVRVIET